MKKILNAFALLFVVLCAGAFVACGTNNKTNSHPPPNGKSNKLDFTEKGR